MSAETPPAAEAAEVRAQTPPPAKPAPATRGRTRARLIAIAALAAVTVGGYLYWKLQQSARPPTVASYAAPEALIEPAPEPPMPEAPVAESADAPVLADVQTAPETAVEPPIDEVPAEAAVAPTAPDVSDSDVLDADTDATADTLALEARVAELEAAVAALAAAPAPPTGDAATLAVAEAGDLAALADQRLRLARDVNGAMVALRLAISRLASGEFPAQRRALLADLAALEAFRDVDVAALSTELAELSRAAPGFRLAGPAPLAAATAPAPVTDWRSLLAAIGSSLRGLVEVRDADETRDPLLDPAHAALARQQLVLDLSAARVAVLQRDAAEFRAALTSALDALATRFDPGDPAVVAALTRLRELNDVELAPALPTLARSVDALAAAPAPAESSAPAAGLAF